MMKYKQVVAIEDEATAQLTFSDGTQTRQIMAGDKLEIVEYRTELGEEVAVVRDWTPGAENFGGFKSLPRMAVIEIPDSGER